VEPQLDDHVRNSLRIGVEPREITEVMVHLAPYVGVPRALAGLRVAAAAFRDLDPEQEPEPEQEQEPHARTNGRVRPGSAGGDA
jgi:4-carboxymuconolactone decarboxylase